MLCASANERGRLRSTESLAGLLNRASRGLSDCPAVLNDVLQALTGQLALDRGKLLHRLGLSQLVQSVEVALPLTLSKTEPAARGILKGLGQNRAATRDRFHVLLGLAGETLAVLTRKA